MRQTCHRLVRTHITVCAAALLASMGCTETTAGGAPRSASIFTQPAAVTRPGVDCRYGVEDVSRPDVSLLGAELRNARGGHGLGRVAGGRASVLLAGDGADAGALVELTGPGLVVRGFVPAADLALTVHRRFVAGGFLVMVPPARAAFRGPRSGLVSLVVPSDAHVALRAGELIEERPCEDLGIGHVDDAGPTLVPEDGQGDPAMFSPGRRVPLSITLAGPVVADLLPSDCTLRVVVIEDAPSAVRVVWQPDHRITFGWVPKAEVRALDAGEEWPLPRDDCFAVPPRRPRSAVARRPSGPRLSCKSDAPLFIALGSDRFEAGVLRAAQPFAIEGLDGEFSAIVPEDQSLFLAPEARYLARTADLDGCADLHRSGGE